jgi:nicotinate-nucleotide pyrophosphorylase (carboxylating)
MKGMFVPRKILEEKLKNLLAEDVGMGDVTSAAVIPLGLQTQAEVIAKERGIAAGIEEATILAESLGLEVKTKVADGDEIKHGQRIMKVVGDARTLLSAERTMLNLLSRMSGIASETKRLTEILKKANSKARIAATRKTAPGLLYFDKKAVIIGGGDPHRLHLDDMILLKDNHITIVGDVKTAVEKAKQTASFTKKIEIEVSRVADVLQVARAGADIVMLDNFSPEQIRKAIGLLKKAGLFGKTLLEASGGITAENLAEYASTQVNIISVGALTHSAKALDISLEIVPVK